MHAKKAGPEYWSTKVEAALPILKRGQSLIYSSWRKFGVVPITTSLKKLGISFKTFTGSTPVKQRQSIIDSFNKGKFQVLVVTKAGGEGLDLVGVRSVVILDPTWNDAGLQQVIGRAIRFQSHAHLPPSERNVKVYMMVLVAPKDIKDPISTGDQILYHFIKVKIDAEKEIMQVLRKDSITR